MTILQLGCDGQKPKENTPNQPTQLVTEIVNLYAHRAFTPGLLEGFENNMETRVAITMAAADSLIAKLDQEGTVKSADLVIFGDLGDMFELKNKGMLQPFSTEILEENIASRNMDYEGTWMGLSKWAMAFIFPRHSTDERKLVQYSDLANPQWKGKLLLTQASNRANQTLVASMLATEGEASTRRWLTGMIANLAEAPLENSFAMMKALNEKRGTVGLINASVKLSWQYSGNPDYFKLADTLAIKYPVNPEGGTYYNLTSAGLFLNTPHRHNSLKLLEYLSGKAVQETFGNSIQEYPVNLFALPNDFLIEVGGFSEKRIDFSEVARQMENARALMKEAGWQ
ncbi:MAG: iron ABC transporter substrate-binding protein [Saprospiraceae bacterium]|nr:MAG: iron ABC transporter substrate-binding protein [Saprospiraceae bacterium]